MFGGDSKNNVWLVFASQKKHGTSKAECVVSHFITDETHTFSNIVID